MSFFHDDDVRPPDRVSRRVLMDDDDDDDRDVEYARVLKQSRVDMEQEIAVYAESQLDFAVMQSQYALAEAEERMLAEAILLSQQQAQPAQPVAPPQQRAYDLEQLTQLKPVLSRLAALDRDCGDCYGALLAAIEAAEEGWAHQFAVDPVDQPTLYEAIKRIRRTPAQSEALFAFIVDN